MTDTDNETKLMAEIKELTKRNQEFGDDSKLYTNPERNKKNCETVKQKSKTWTRLRKQIQKNYKNGVI